VEERKIGRLIALKTKFEEISKKAEYLLNLEIKSSYMKYPSESEIIAIIEDYNSALSHLNKLDLADLALILPSISQTAEYGNLHKIIINSHAAVNAIDSLIPKKIPSELANQLNDWRDEINKIEDYDICKNLNEALNEMRYGHYIASGLISARVIIWILQQIPPERKDIQNKDKKKVDTLIKARVIKKDDRDIHERILRAARFARHFVSHRIDRYPTLNDANSLLSDAVKLGIIYTSLKKKR